MVVKALSIPEEAAVVASVWFVVRYLTGLTIVVVWWARWLLAPCFSALSVGSA